MPYKVEPGHGCPAGQFAVVKETDGERMGCHPTKDHAMRQMAALYAAEAEPNLELRRLIEYAADVYTHTETIAERGYVRDKRGRFASGKTVGASEAVDVLARGGSPNIAPGDVGAVMDQMAGRSDHPDLTDLQVDGTLKFGGDGLGFARNEMPVLGRQHLPGYLADVQARGIKVTDGRVEPQHLKAMQKEVSATSSARMYQSMKTEPTLLNKPVVVSSDNFVIDGNHRWGAATALSFERPGITLAVTRIDLPGEALRSDAVKWNNDNGISLKGLGEALLAERTYVRDARGRFAVHGGSSGMLNPNSPAVAERAAAIRAAAEAVEPKVTADMHEMAAAAGGELTGLDFRLKTEASLRRKLATDPDYVKDRLTLDQRAAKSKDSIRYTTILSPGDYGPAIDRAVERAHALGYQTNSKNIWRLTNKGYAGYHVSLSKPGHPVIEMQFHTQRTFTLKEFGDPAHGIPPSHVLYEQLRTSRSKREKAAVEAKIASVWSPIRASAPFRALSMP